MKSVVALVLTFALIPAAAAMAQDKNLHQEVVTAVPRHPGGEPIGQGAVTVQVNGQDGTVRGWQPVDAKTNVDLAIIIDDDTQNISVQLGDLRDFIRALPPNVQVGVGYMSAGAILFTQSKFTPERNLIIQKLRPPSSAPGSSPSPYGSIQYLMSRWRPQPDRIHEMLLISDGVEHLGGNDANNITVKKAIADTVQDGVVVYSIFVTGASSAGVGQNGAPVTTSGPSFPGGGGPGIIRGMSGESDSSGAMNLGELTEATGGETYAENSGTPPRFTSFLDDLLQRLNNQYLLSFDTTKAKSGLDSLKIDVRASDRSVTVPKKIFISQ